jgi:hypothetical protein
MQRKTNKQTNKEANKAKCIEIKSQTYWPTEVPEYCY